MSAILVDLTFALGTLQRSPLFNLIAVLSLALGIGANTAIFSLMDQLLLRLLPVKDPESLVMLSQRGPNMGGNDGERANSYPIYQDYQRRAEAFSEVFCQKMAEAAITLDGQSELVSAEMVSGNYFSALGLKPAKGRLFVHGTEYSPLDTPARPCWLTARGATACSWKGTLTEMARTPTPMDHVTGGQASQVVSTKSRRYFSADFSSPPATSTILCPPGNISQPEAPSKYRMYIAPGAT